MIKKIYVFDKKHIYKYMTIISQSLKVHQLHEFAIWTSSKGGNERWELISQLVQFSDVNPNSYDNLKNMKLDLNVSTKIKFSVNDQGL